MTADDRETWPNVHGWGNPSRKVVTPETPIELPTGPAPAAPPIDHLDATYRFEEAGRLREERDAFAAQVRDLVGQLIAIREQRDRMRPVVEAAVAYCQRGDEAFHALLRAVGAFNRSVLGQDGATP